MEVERDAAVEKVKQLEQELENIRTASSDAAADHAEDLKKQNDALLKELQQLKSVKVSKFQCNIILNAQIPSDQPEPLQRQSSQVMETVQIENARLQREVDRLQRELELASNRVREKTVTKYVLIVFLILVFLQAVYETICAERDAAAEKVKQLDAELDIIRVSGSDSGMYFIVVLCVVHIAV